MFSRFLNLRFFFHKMLLVVFLGAAKFLFLQWHSFCFNQTSTFQKYKRRFFFRKKKKIVDLEFDLMSTLFESRNQNKNKSNGSSVSLIRHFLNWRPDCNLDFRVAPRPRDLGHNHNPLVLQIGLLHRDLLRQKRKKVCEKNWIKKLNIVVWRQKARIFFFEND